MAKTMWENETVRDLLETAIDMINNGPVDKDEFERQLEKALENLAANVQYARFAETPAE